MKKYFIDNELVSEEKFYQVLEEENDSACRDSYDDVLDDCYDIIKIGCCELCPSYVLKNCDPVAYLCGLSDYISSNYDDLSYDLEHYGQCTINGFDFTIEEE